jgi:hypothetical protein
VLAGDSFFGRLRHNTAAWAWGSEGHQIIAHIAARELIPMARAGRLSPGRRDCCIVRDRAYISFEAATVGSVNNTGAELVERLELPA